MAHKILKSLLPTDQHVDSFQRLCNTHIEEMRAYDRQVENNKKNPGKYHLYPPPTAHPDIMNSIIPDRKDYNIEFEIEDDTPKPPLPPTLEEKKIALIQQELTKLSEIQEKIIPSRKRRLMAIEAYDISQLKNPSKKQKLDLQQYQDLMDRMDKAARHFAKLESTIDDLTENNIDNWKSEVFPGAEQ